MKPTGLQKNMDRLLAAVQELSLARSLDRVMHIVRTAARELTGADGATFILRKNDLCYYADEDAIGPLWKGQEFPMSHCISGWAMIHHETVIIEDIYADDRVPHDAYKPTFVKSLVIVPIRTIDPIGAIGNYWAEKHLPAAEEIQLLQALADMTMVTLENIKVYNELEQRVKDRTAELEASNHALEAFSYSVSHDLHAPLRKINYFTQLLSETYLSELNDKGRGWLLKLTEKVAEMRQLIDVLLEFSKTGSKTLEKDMVPVKKMVEDVAHNLREQENGRNIQMVIGTLPDIPADATLLRQVWINLISNALKYTAKKDRTVINIGSEEKENAIVYCIKDNGAGFDMKYYNTLFTAFQRLHPRNEFEGTGIGLATVERIITKHGGRIWAESSPDQGACFFFQLPKN